MSSVPSRGELYDWEQTHVIGRTDQDVAFYRDLTDGAAAVLELGCGTGRLTGPLHEGGAAIIGVDHDAEMLAVARARDVTLRLVCADARRLAFARPFDVVLAPYNFLQLLPTTADRMHCLITVASHLAPDGVFATEVHDFVAEGADADVELEPLHTGRLGDAEVILHAGLRVDRVARTTTYLRRFEVRHREDAAEVSDDVALYSFAPGELLELLRAAGLEGEADGGGVVQRWTARRIG